MGYNSRAKAAISTSDNIVGSIQKVYGKDGELVIRLWDTFPENITEPLWVEIDSLAVPLFMSAFKPQGTSKAVVVFDDFDTEEKTAILVGKKLYSENAQETTDNGGDWNFLIGYTITDSTSGSEGIITNFINSDLNPMIEVEISTLKHLLPIAEELIEKIDKKKKNIVVHLAEGIFEL